MKEGDFIRLEFDAFVKDTDHLVDTTHEDVAKEHDVWDERARYGPISVIVGGNHVVKGLDSDLLSAAVGKEKEVEVLPKDAFGERDPKLVEIYPMNKILSLPEFRKGDRYPTEGMPIKINNRSGYISRIFAGRVRVDFNPRFAGKAIIYKYKVTEALKKKEEKIRAVIEAVYGNPDQFTFKAVGKDQVDIVLPDMAKLDPSWTMTKFKLVADLRKHLGLRTVRLIEEYLRKDEEEGEEKTEEKKEGEEKPTSEEKEQPAGGEGDIPEDEPGEEISE